ncbi:MAG: hypothetical protein MPN21_01230 [Thermoanaerobaculia bacterium]|nr:hypothetical protein [Thermoanaerobaculia bacterium]
MSLTIATWLARALELYLLAGVLFAVPFAWRGAGRVDPVARDGTWGFRLLILPGTIALWPLLATRWLRGVVNPPQEKNAHRNAKEAKP